MTEIKNQTGTKKKLLIPVVVLMLLGVALAGAAYAYSSTLTVDNNTVEAKSLTLDLSSGAAQATDVVSDFQIVTFTDNYSYAWNSSANPPAYEKSNTVKYQLIDTKIAVYKIKVTGDADANTFKVSSTDLADLQPFVSVDPAKTATLGSLFNFKYTIGTNNTYPGTVLGATTLGEEATVTLTKNTDYYVIVYADAVDNTETTLGSVSNAAAYASAVDGLSFTLKLEASYVA